MCLPFLLLIYFRSTDFQMTFAPKAWQTERVSWRVVIQLNLVRAVNAILDALAAEMQQAPRPASRAMSGITSTPSSPPTSSSGILGDADEPEGENHNDEDEDGRVTTSSHAGNMRLIGSEANTHSLAFTSQHSIWKMSLAPLRSVESDLKGFLGSGSEEINASDPGFNAERSMATPFDGEPPAAALSSARRTQEFTVRSMHSWKSAVGNRSRPTSPRMQTSELDRVTEVIAGCREDVQALWQDTLVKELLRRKKVKFQDSAV